MTEVLHPQTTEFLQGAIERVTFHNPENGFCVIRVKVKKHRDLITVIGNAASITPGEFVECRGEWGNDLVHGLQFKANALKVVAPKTLEGIEKYLGSGMVKGIGPHFAKKLVRAFGEAVFDVIETEPQRLLSLEGIGSKRQQMVVSAWHEQKTIRLIMVFLQSHGVGTARAVRIYKTYGDQAIEKVTENPYRLALDIFGIGFKTADQIAQCLGFEKHSLLRAEAGVRHTVQVLCDSGHCAVKRADLMLATHTLLDIPSLIIEAALASQLKEALLIAEQIAEEPCIYPVALYKAEVNAAACLRRLNTGVAPWGQLKIDEAIPWVEQQTGLKLSASQQQAIRQIFTSKLAIITGGPGVGKTTLVNSLLKIVKAKRLSISLCAPTGRAAKRLAETTGLAAKTIHRVLEFNPRTRGFNYNQHNLLAVDVVICDESSMIDVVLLNHLVKAIPTHAAVIFVGDIDQLPSVGSGAVLADLIRSNVITTVRLTEIFRQAAASQIIVNAHRVNQGLMPLANTPKNSDFYTIYVDTPEAIREALLDVVVKRLPKFYRCNPIQDIQILTPMNRGGLGSRGLNIVLQAALNPHAEPKITRFGTTYSPGDKIIQLVNNYDKEVFNGDLGVIESIDNEAGHLTILFDQQKKIYATNELDEIQLAYAISIHKSQGSEFPIVVIPISTQHFALLARNLLYTGLTRGKSLVVLIGQKKAIGMAISNQKESQRITNLAGRLIL